MAPATEILIQVPRLRLPEARITLQGREIPYTIRHSTRARHLGLRASAEAGLVLTVPRGTAEEAIQNFLARHARWILRQLDWLHRKAASCPRYWPYGPTFPFAGEAHQVLIQQGPVAAVCRTDSRELRLTLRHPSIEGARRLLTRWLKAQATQVLRERTREVGARMGLAARRIYVRNLKRRWGSCWPGGSLSFSYRLVMAPPRILDYVVVHELAHLREPNHSPRFWALVAQHDPDPGEAKRWLRTLGPSLGV